MFTSIFAFSKDKSCLWKTAAIVMLVAGVVGMLDSFYLVLEYLAVLLHPGEPTPCTVNSLVSCTLTVQGVWGHYFTGVPNPMLGMLWYSGVTAYAVIRSLGTDISKKARVFVGFILVLGILFSYRLYLASVLELGGVCPFCLTSTVASTLILLAFAVDDATYQSPVISQFFQRCVYVFQAFSILVFVIGLPVFLAHGLSWVPQPLEVILHWSFPVMVLLVLLMAAGHVWTFRTLRTIRRG